MTPVQLPERSARCARCGRWINRGVFAARWPGGRWVHARCVPEDLIERILATLWQHGPARICEVARSVNASAPLVAKRLRQMLERGIVRRAGDYWRKNAEIETIEAAIAAWRTPHET